MPTRLLPHILSVVILGFIFVLASSSVHAAPPAAEDPPANAEPPAPTPIDRVAIDVAPLKKWGTQRFSYHARDEKGRLIPAGGITMRTHVDDKGVRLDDTGSLLFDTIKLALSLQVEAAAGPRLAPSKIAIQQDVGGDLRAVTGEVLKTHIAGELHDGDESTPVNQPLSGEGVTTDFGLFRVVTLLPTTPGKSYKIGDVIRMSTDLIVVRDVVVTCVGPDPLFVEDNQRIPCTRYRVNQAGVYGFDFWVDEKRQLQRINIHHLDRRIERLRPKQDGTDEANDDEVS